MGALGMAKVGEAEEMEAGLPPENFILPLFTDFLGKMLQKCQVLQIFGHKAKHPPLLLKIPNFEKSRYTD